MKTPFPVSLNRTSTATATLPDFVTRRMERFYDERVAVAWGGHHILRGLRPDANALMLQSNDYLSITRHPHIVEAQQNMLGAAGNGMMISGLFVQDEDNSLRRLEQTLASALGFETAILAQSGYNANVGLVQSIVTERTPVYIDMFAHASLWEGVKSGGGIAIPVVHNDAEHLERQVLRHGPGVILVDSVYSINGSVCPLEDYAQIAQSHGCVFVVDESHSLGTHGAHGEGLVASLGLNDRVHFVTASLAKTYCARAGLIACPSRFKDYFGCESLPAVFSSTLLPAEIAGIEATHNVIEREGWRRARLAHVTRRVRSEMQQLGYPIAEGSEQIIALEAGVELLTIRVRDAFESRGVFGAIFSAPATAKNRSLLRFTLNAGMTDTDIDRLITVCAELRDQIELENWSATRRSRRHHVREEAAVYENVA